MDCRIKSGNDELRDRLLALIKARKKKGEAERRQTLAPTCRAAGTAAAPLHILPRMRGRIWRGQLACRRSTAALTCGLSPAARDFRPGFLGRGKNADL